MMLASPWSKNDHFRTCFVFNDLHHLLRSCSDSVHAAAYARSWPCAIVYNPLTCLPVGGSRDGVNRFADQAFGWAVGTVMQAIDERVRLSDERV